MKQAAERLKQAVSAGIFLTDEPMSRHTTFRTGGPGGHLHRAVLRGRIKAGAGYLPGRKPGVYHHWKWQQPSGRRQRLPGRADLFWEAIWTGRSGRHSGAGGCRSPLSVVAKQALNASLTGFEFAAGIPGTIGGAVVMNAGAYGGELCQVLKEATVLTPESEVRILPAAELELGYRTSCVQKNGYMVLEAVLELQPGNAEKIRAVMDELASKRKEKQPLEYPSAGSTFKRPAGHFAGKLIQDAGLRGFTVGGAQVSEKHCGFVINRDMLLRPIFFPCADRYRIR